LETLDDAGLRLVVANEGVDTAQEAQTMFLTIKGAIARDQWKRHQANWKAAKHATWEKGIPGAQAPAGYDAPVIGTKDNGKPDHGPLEVNGRAADIKAAFALRASGGTFPAVARLLGCGVSSARQIIANDVYKGVVGCGCGCGQTRRESDLALVSPAVWNAAQSAKEEPGVRSGRGPGSGSSLLAGVLRCAGCGAILQKNTTTVRGKRYPFYRCQNDRCSARATVSAENAEEYLVGLALDRLTAGGLKEEKVDTAPLEARVAAAEDELRAYQAAVPAITPGFAEAVGARATALGAAQDALEDARARGGTTFLTAEQAREVFDHGNVDQQRAILRDAFPGGAVVKQGRGLPVTEKIAVGRTACGACGAAMMLGLLRCPECGMEVAAA